MDTERKAICSMTFLGDKDVVLLFITLYKLTDIMGIINTEGMQNTAL